MKVLRKTLSVAAAILIGCGMIALLVFPLPVGTEAAGGVYLCEWEDGTRTEESYASAYTDFSHVDEEGRIILTRENGTGTIVPSDDFSAFYRTVTKGSIADLLSLPADGLKRLEQFAAYRFCSDKVWVSGGAFFAYSTAFTRVDPEDAEEVILLDGSITAARLIKWKTTSLHIRSDASVTSKTLRGTLVSSVSAQPPYYADGTALYLDTAGGRRLVSGIPSARNFVMKNCDFADEGALLPCGKMETLTLGFVGNSASDMGSDFRGELAHLFSTGSEYLVPSTLRKVTVTGGVLVSHAFYRCSSLQEIDACGMDKDKIDGDAFVDCVNLQSLHSPRADVRLQGNFVSTVLPCGCTLFERTE